MYAQDEVYPIDTIQAWDNSEVDYRKPAADTIAYFRSLPEYTYNEVKVDNSWLNTVWSWIMSLIPSGESAKWIGWALIVCAVLALLAIIIKLFGIPIKGLFVFSKSTNVTDLTFGSSEVDLENEELDKQLRTLISHEAFREATRILFLMALREMNRLKLIKWSVWKTDREYYYEIQDQNLKNDFLTAIRHYEYVWYGKFEPGKVQFEEIRSRFDQLNNKVKSLQK